MKRFLLIIPIVLLSSACSFRATQNTNQPPKINLNQTYSNIRDNYSFRYPMGYEVRGFTEYGNDVASTPQDAGVGVKANGSTEFIFNITETAMSSATLTPQSIMAQITKNGLNTNDFTITDTEVNGLQGYKVVNNNQKDKVVSDTYDLQLKNGKIFDITVVKNNDISKAIFDSLVFGK